MIDGIIPVQHFEVIRDAIAGILIAEIQNQEALTGNKYVNSYFAERFIPPDETEYPLINIVYMGGDYDGADMTIVNGSYVYQIGVFTSATSNGSSNGDKKASVQLHRVLGLIRAILMNPIYKTLGLPAGYIREQPIINSMRVARNEETKDANYSIMGYVEVVIKASEDVLLIDPIPLANSVTQVKLYLTEKGYRYGDGDELSFLEAENSTNNNPVYLIAE
jgi:hypothetical protein